MVKSEEIELFKDHLNSLSTDNKVFYGDLLRVKSEYAKSSLIQKSEEYIKSEVKRLERLKGIYGEFSSIIIDICDEYMGKMNTIEKEHNKEIEGLRIDFENINEELNEKTKELKEKSFSDITGPSFVYKDGTKSIISADLVTQYPGSYLYREYINGVRTSDGDIFVDCEGDYDELIVKYMENDDSLIEDVKSLKNADKEKFIDDLNFLELPIKKDMIDVLSCAEKIGMIEAWMNRKYVIVNNRFSKIINKWIDQNNFIYRIIINKQVKKINYNEENLRFFINIHLKYMDMIEDYIMNDMRLNEDLLKKYKNVNASSIINEFRMIGIFLSEVELKQIRKISYEPLFKNESYIIYNYDFDKKLQEWLDYRFGWKLIYRASEHDYTAKSFHEYCDNKGPTLIVIKSSEGWIFGGYTTKSWSGWSI